MAPILQLEGVSKSFGAVKALTDVDFELRESEVVALVGDNGAGKSTLVKIISGALSPDSGIVRFEGQVVRILKPEDARRLGIETVYQDLSLFDNSDVALNIFAGRELTWRVLGIPILRGAAMHATAEKLLQSLKIQIHSTSLAVKGLSGGQRQTIAIARAVAFGKRIVILDEPTAALGVPEQQKVLSLIKDLKQKGFSVIIVSHNLQQVFEVCDRLHVLLHGQTAGVRDRDATNPDEIVKLITGGHLVGAA